MGKLNFWNVYLLWTPFVQMIPCTQMGMDSTSKAVTQQEAEVEHWDNTSHQLPNELVESVPAQLHAREMEETANIFDFNNVLFQNKCKILRILTGSLQLLDCLRCTS